MKTIKTALSLLLMLCMLCSLATAAFADGDAGDPSLPPAASVSDPAPAAGESGPAVTNVYNTGSVTGGSDAQPPAAGATAQTSGVIKDTVAVTVSKNESGEKYSNVTVGDLIVVTPDSPQGEIYDVTLEYTDSETVNIGGSIDASQKEGLNFLNNAGSITVNIGDKDTVGNVTGSCGDGILAVFAGDNSKLTVWGDVEGKGTVHGSGITVLSFTGESEIDVKGDVTGGSAAGSAAAGITVFNEADDANLSITVGGDVKGSDSGGGISIVDAYGGNTNITVGSVDSDGNVTGGTVTGGIQLNDGVTAQNTSITAWKVNGDITGAEDSVIQKVINYIVGLVQPDEGKISASKQTANAGDKVYLKAGNGYQIKEAYNGEGSSEPLKKDGKGFYWEVQPGGGVLLSAVLEKIKPAPAATDLSFSAVKFTFDLDGGTLDGETGKVVKWFAPGTTVKLPAAPTKTDSTFAGWQTKVGGEVKVFQAGEKFTVTAAQDFTALWD